MKIIVVRHGQTNYNVKKLVNYDPKINVYLTQQGISEAELVGKQLKSEEIDAVYVSELPRTHQTAKIIMPEASLIIDARLNDINNGFEGKLVSEYKAQRDQSQDPYTYRLNENSESSQDVYDRVADFIKCLRRQKYSTVLVVTSAHTWRHFYNILDHHDPATTLPEHVPNAAVLTREI